MIFACPFCQTKVQKAQNVCHQCNATMTRHCPYCAEPVSVLANLCKYCGEAIEPTSTPTRPARLVVPAPAPAAAAPVEVPEVEFVDEVRYCAWEDGSKKGSFGRWWSTWANSQFSPSQFWSHLPTEGGHARPHKFAWYMFAQVLMLLMPVVGIAGIVVGIEENAPAYAYPLGAAAYLALFPLSYVAIALGNYVRAALWHLPLKLLGAKGGYEQTLRAVAYNTGACVWSVIPGLGGIIKAVMGTVGYYYAFRGVHGMSKGRAVFAALLPITLAVLAITAMVVAVASGAIDCPVRNCAL